MKVDSFKRSQNLELQKQFLYCLLRTKPSQFKEFSIILKDYSKRGLTMNAVYNRLFGNPIRALDPLSSPRTTSPARRLG